MTHPVPLFRPTLADLIIMAGSRYRLVIDITCDWETDFTDWTAEMQMRSNRSATGVLIADLSDYATVSGPASQVTVDIPADAAEILGAEMTNGVYDIVIAPSDDATRALRVVQGTIIIDTEVSR